MALADEIRALRDRALADLNAVHNYYTETAFAWEIVRSYIAAGNTFIIRNQVTGSETTQADLAANALG
jgi:hypothetical protein